MWPNLQGSRLLKKYLRKTSFFVQCNRWNPIYKKTDVHQVSDIKYHATFNIHYVIQCHQSFCSLHKFFHDLIVVPSLLCFYLVTWKQEITFKIKKEDIFGVSLNTKMFVFLINFVCLTFDVSRGEWLGWGKKVKDFLCGSENMDASPFQNASIWMNFIELFVRRVKLVELLTLSKLTQAMGIVLASLFLILNRHFSIGSVWQFFYFYIKRLIPGSEVISSNWKPFKFFSWLFWSWRKMTW